MRTITAAMKLRRRLVALDAGALLIARLPVQIWKTTIGLDIWNLLMVEAVLLVSGVLLLRAQGMYLSRVVQNRTQEIRLIVQAAVLLGVAQAVLFRVMGVRTPLSWLCAGPITLVVLMVWMRGAYRAWLSATRAAGRHLREVIVLGTSADAADLVSMFADHPEAGYRVTGVMGDAELARTSGLASLRIGPVSDIYDAQRIPSVSGVVIVMGSVPSREIPLIVDRLMSLGVHVQLSDGLHGTSHRRLRAAPVAHQSMFYLEPPSRTQVSLVAKRVIDVCVSVITLVLASPLILTVALVIKISDGGPVLYRQVRVGRRGLKFEMLKFRSMVVDAESKLADLHRPNERLGPLFKVSSDPRVTRVGRFLRASSLDELPQLMNVLTGSMSLVGPRPALPSEVAEFDARLLDRLKMPPGITGLWQVEARGNPNFGAYRRLDLFYVDNWTLGLDTMILIATVEQVVSRAIRLVVRRQPAPCAYESVRSQQVPSFDELSV